MKRGPKPRPVARRIFARVREDGGCWIFTGSLKGGTGYGQVLTGELDKGTRRNESAHRVMYEAFIGDVPEGFDVHHVCARRACVNPLHLEAVERSEHGRQHGLEKHGRVA